MPSGVQSSNIITRRKVWFALLVFPTAVFRASAGGFAIRVAAVSRVAKAQAYSMRPITMSALRCDDSADFSRHSLGMRFQKQAPPPANPDAPFLLARKELRVSLRAYRNHSVRVAPLGAPPSRSSGAQAAQ